MANIKVGITKPKKKKKGQIELSQPQATEPKAYTAGADASVGGDELTKEAQQKQNLEIKRAQLERSQAQERKEKMENRSTIEKIFNIDPDANFFQNFLSAATFGLTWADDAFGSLASALTGDTENAKAIFDKQWNANEMTGAMDILTHTFSGGNRKTWNEVVQKDLNGSKLASLLGIPVDMFASPTNLAMMFLTPFTGGASGAAVLGKEFAETAKTAKAVDAVSDVAKIGEGIQTASEIGKGANAIAQAVDTASKFDDAVKVALETQSVDKIFYAGKNGTTLAGELKDNPLVKQVWEYGAKNNWNKKSKASAEMFWQQVGSWGLESNQTGQAIFNTEKFADSVGKFSRGRAKMDKWGNGLREALNWGTVPGFKAIGAGAKGVGKGVSKLANSTAKGSQIARNLVNKTEAFKNNRFFRGSQNVSSPSKNAIYQAQAVNAQGGGYVNEVAGQTIKNLDATNSVVADAISKKRMGLPIDEDTLNLKINPQVENSPTLKQFMNDLESNPNFKTYQEEHSKTIKSLLSSDGKQLTNRAKELANKNQDVSSYSVRNTNNLVSKQLSENQKYNEALIEKTMKENDLWTHGQTVKNLNKKGLLKDTNFRPLPKNAQANEVGKYLSDAKKWLGNHQTKIGDETVNSLITQLKESPNVWDKFSKEQQNILTSYLDPLYREIITTTNDRLSNVFKNFFEHSGEVRQGGTSAIADKKIVYNRLLQVMDNPQSLIKELKTQYLLQNDKSLNLGKIQQFDKNFAKFFDNPNSMTEVEGWLHSNVTKDYINQYLKSYVTNSSGEGVINQKATNIVSSILQNGRFDTMDTGRLRSTINNTLIQQTENHIGKKLDTKNAWKMYEKRVTKTQNIMTDKVSKMLTELQVDHNLPSKTKLTNFNDYSKLSDTFQDAILKRLTPKERATFKYMTDVDNDLRNLRYLGDANTQELYSNLKNVIEKPYLNSLLEEQRVEFMASRQKADWITRNNDLRKAKKDLIAIEKNLKKNGSKMPDEQITNLLKEKKALETQIKKIDKVSPESITKDLEKEWKQSLPEMEIQNAKANSILSIEDVRTQTNNKVNPYNRLGKTIKVNQEGQKFLSKQISKLYDGSPTSQKALEILSQPQLDKESSKFIGDLLGLDKKGVQWLHSEQQLTSFTQISQEISQATGWAATNIPIESLKQSVTEIQNLIRDGSYEIGRYLGIDLERIGIDGQWFRDQRDWSVFHDESLKLKGIGEFRDGQQKINVNKIMAANEKSFTKTMDTLGMNSNIFSGNRIISTDVMQDSLKQLDMVADDFKLYAQIEAGLKTGDIKFLSEAEQSQFFTSATMRKKYAQEGTIKLSNGTEIPKTMANGNVLIKASDLTDAFSGMKYLFKPEEYTKFVKSVENGIDLVKGTEFAQLGLNSKLANSYVAVPPAFEDVLGRIAKVPTKNYENFAKGIIGTTYKTIMGVWKQFALLSPAYHIRNMVSNSIQSWVSGINPIKSAGARTKAMADLAHWKGQIEPFSHKVIKKGLSHKVNDEWQALTREIGRVGTQTGVTKIDAVNSLLNKGLITNQDFKLATEILSLESQAILGGIKMHSDMGAFVNVNNALTGQTQKRFLKDNALKYGAKKVWGHTLGGLTDANMRIGAWIDDAARLATYRLGTENPLLFQRLGLKDAAQFTRHVNLDYANMTNFERNVMRKFIPFYSYARHASEMHFKNIFKMPGLYGNMNKILLQQYANYANNNDENDVPSWMRLMGYVPVGGGDNIGYTNIIQLPWQNLADVTNLVGDGLKAASNPSTFNTARAKQSSINLIGQLNPVIKAGMATTVGKNLYGNPNDNVFGKALWNEMGGAFARIPKLVQEVLDNKSNGKDLNDIFGQLLGIYKTLDPDSLSAQRVNELIYYLDEEIKRAGIGNYYSYNYIKNKMFGRPLKQMHAPTPRIIRYKRNKKKIPTYDEVTRY